MTKQKQIKEGPLSEMSRRLCFEEGKKQALEEELKFLESLYSGGYIPSRWKKIEQRKDELKSKIKEMEN